MTSTVHTDHPPVQEAGLADGCPACADIALDPTAHLDDETLAKLATLATSTDRLERGRSETELVAAAYVLSTLERVGRLAETAPEVVGWYLREKWRLDVQIDNPRRAELDALRTRLEGGDESAATGEDNAPQQDDGLTDESRAWLTSDPVCQCGHRLSEHAEEDGPGHAGCRAQVPTEGEAAKGEPVYAECECAGFVSADLEQPAEQPTGEGVAADYADSAE